MSIVKDLEIIPVKTLKEVVEYLSGRHKIQSAKVDLEEILRINNKHVLDFSDVKGQENVKRALEISAAGGHNCLLIGSPGSRKNHVGKKNFNNFT